MGARLVVEVFELAFTHDVLIACGLLVLAGGHPPDGTPFRITPRYQTAHPAYQCLNRLVCVG